MHARNSVAVLLTMRLFSILYVVTECCKILCQQNNRPLIIIALDVAGILVIIIIFIRNNDLSYNNY